MGFVSRTYQINQTFTLKNQKDKTQSGRFKEKKEKEGSCCPQGSRQESPGRERDLRGVLPLWGLAPQPCPRLAAPTPPCPGGCGPGVGGLFFPGGSGELGRLIVLFVSQSHAVMSAVTSCSALPIGLRCLPAGPASRPPNFPCTPLRSHRPGRGSPRAAGPRRAGGAQRGTAPRSRAFSSSSRPGWAPGFRGLAAGLCGATGFGGSEPNLCRALNSAGNPLVLPGVQAGAMAAFGPGAAGRCLPLPWCFGVMGPRCCPSGTPRSLVHSRVPARTPWRSLGAR